jgi:phosphoribosylformylglycinamidine synthase I
VLRCAVIVFPGTWSDTDCYHVLDSVYGVSVDYVWHQETDLSKYDIAFLPGGFSYGDYLRPGAIAQFSPIMAGIELMVQHGKTVIGICNGFQVLCEAGILPGVLLKNSHLQYRCQWTNLRVENNMTRFTQSCDQEQILSIPISHGDGNYYADPETIIELEKNEQILFKYSSDVGEVTSPYNPNGSLNNIAGVTNTDHNVLGMMPHPERSCEAITGGEDGRFIFESILNFADITPNKS